MRGAFPALQRTGSDGRPLAFLDGPGGVQVPRAVIDAMASYLTQGSANCGGAFVTSRQTDALIANARAAAADLTGAAPEEIAFGPNMTTMNFALAHAVARTLAPGDEILTTDLDHDANVAPWLQVAADHGLVVRQVHLDRATFDLDYAALEGMLTARTRIVAFTLASNALGTVTDARRISDAAHRVGALAWADAVHFAPHRRMNRDALGVDVLLCSPYKFFGPHAGLAVIRRDLAETWPADRVRPADEHPAGHRFETGTGSHEAIAGTLAAVDYLASLSGADPVTTPRAQRLDLAFDQIALYEESLSERFLAGIRGMDGITLWGRPGSEARTATFCWSVAGRHPREVATRLADQGLLVWDGNYYALSVMRALGLEPHGAVRAGFVHYTTADEVDRLLEAVDATR